MIPQQSVGAGVAEERDASRHHGLSRMRLDDDVVNEARVLPIYRNDGQGCSHQLKIHPNVTQGSPMPARLAEMPRMSSGYHSHHALRRPVSAARQAGELVS